MEYMALHAPDVEHSELAVVTSSEKVSLTDVLPGAVADDNVGS